MKIRPSSSFQRWIASPLLRLGVVSAAVIPAARALDYSWAVTGTSSWATSSNWTPNGSPGAEDTITVGGAAATTITMDSAKSVSSVSVSNTGTTVINAASGGPRGLTIGAGGITVAAGSGLMTIGGTTAASNVNIVLGASQSWSSAIGGTHLIRGGISGSGMNLTLTGSYDLRTHAGGTPVINLGTTGTVTQNSGGLEIGTGVNTMAGFVLKGGFVYARNIGNFGTTGPITVGDSAPNSTVIGLRLASGTWTRPVVLASGSTGLIYIDNLGATAVPVFNGGITGTNNLTIQSTIGSGSGSVTVGSAAIDFTGALTLRNQGTGSAATAVGTVTMNSAITDKVTNVTMTDVTSGTKGVQKIVLGSAANAWAGNTTISANTRVELNAAEVIPHGAGKGNVTVNGTLILRTATGDSTETINGLSGSGAINRSGTAGTSTLVTGDNDGGGNFSGNITDGAGKVALTKVGTGTLVLSGVNTYTGVTTVAGGTLQLDFPDLIADTATIDLEAGAILDLPHADLETVSNLRFDGVNQATGKWGRVGSSAAFGANFESDRITGDGLLDVTNLYSDSYWDGTGTSWAAAASWSTSVTDAAANPAAGPGTNNATRFGIEGLFDDQLIELNGDQSTPAMYLTSPVAFSFTGGNADHVLSVGLGGILMYAASLGVSFGSTTPGQEVDLVVGGSQLWSNASLSGDLVASNAVDLVGSTLTVGGAGDTFFDGVVSGSGGITKTGAGVLGLYGANDFTGAVSVQAGTVQLGNPGGLGGIATGTTVTGGTLDLNGQAVMEPITLGGSVVNNNPTEAASLEGTINLTANSNAGGPGDLSLSGVISQTGGARNLTKTGTGKLTISNANLYTGTTTIANNTGTVAITNGAALGSGPVAITRGGVTTGTLELSNDITVANVFTFASATGFGGAGTSAQVRNVSGSNTLTGTLSLTATGGNGINLESASGLLTITNTVTSTIADNTRQLGIAGAGDGLISGNIVNTGVNQFSVVKSGTGTWTLSGTNTYTGSTNVNAGVLVLTKNGGLADAAPVSVGSEGVLRLEFTGSDTVASLVLGGVLQGPGIYTAANSGGRITGDGSLTVPDTDPFSPWINGFTFEAGADKSKTGDPDGDGIINLLEFAFDGNPASGTANDKIASKIDAGHLTLTLPVRTDAVFKGTGPLISEAIGDVIYEIGGSEDLAGFTAGVEETTALTEGMPTNLSTGWTYRTFRLTGTVSAVLKGFIRAEASDAP
ncbi:beta strand repeat-containing protein [Luteolibacter sp. Populi]|uniref:beta strand repeat-containing protein n=1 Tax=Luteolibacter sp. Populi TaxID=3230487 RepID=UPI00346794BE